MKAILDGIEKVLGYLLTALVALIVAGVCWQVISRYILQAPSSVTEELARFLLIWIGLFGAAYAYKHDSHLGLDILTNRMQGCRKFIATLFAHICVLTFSVVVMCIGGVALVNLTLDPAQTSAALEVQMGYIYAAVPLSGLLISLFAIEKIINCKQTQVCEQGE